MRCVTIRCVEVRGFRVRETCGLKWRDQLCTGRLGLKPFRDARFDANKVASLTGA